MVGTILSHYRILEELGRGGMGIVYKAEDTKLDRTVAIKVLPSAALGSEDDRQRFYREAKAAAQLHHPHIASIFEIDEAVPEGAGSDDVRPFIAMEFIDGETLDDTIKKGPLKLSEGVRIAGEIAEALRAAHAKDIVHRDIKSANVMLDADGRAKVLDFGLAKTAQSTKLTRMGSTLGTMAYMSPEQARGEEVDRRTDIWALGAVLYEMISGRPPFAGDYEQAVVYSILNEQPEPLTALRTGVPMGLEWIVTKALAKKAADRYQSVADLIVDLKNVDTASVALSRSVSVSTSAAAVQTPAAVETRASRSITRIGGIVAAIVVVALMGWYIGMRSTPEAVRPFSKLSLHIDGLVWANHPIMSPDEAFFVVAGEDTLGRAGIYLHDFESTETRFLQGTDNHQYPILSPSGHRLASSPNGQGVWVTAVPGGLPVQWADAGRAGAWEDENTLIIEYDGDTHRLRGPGAPLETVARADSVPGAEVFLYTGDILQQEGVLLASFQYASNANANLVVVNLQSGAFNTLESAAINAWYVPEGFVLYQLGTDEGPMVVRRFNRNSLSWTGPPQEILPETEWYRVRPTRSGGLLYIRPSRERIAAHVEWLEDDGSRTFILPLSQELWYRPSLSPDGRSLLIMNSRSAAQWNVTLKRIDLETGDVSSVASDPGEGTWSADGSEIFRTTSEWALSHIVRQGVAALNIADSVIADARHPSLSSDGNLLAYTSGSYRSRSDIRVLNLSTGDTLIVANSADTEVWPSISPDGRWVAYLASLAETLELRVAGLNGSNQQVLARDVDSKAQWSSDGQSLYFVRDGNVFRMRVRANDRFTAVGSPEQLTSDGLVQDLTVDPSSGRILLLTDDRRPPGYVVIEWWQNWADELDRTLPRY